MTKYNYKNIEFKSDSIEKWWRPEIDKDKLKELHKKRNLPGLINTFLYFLIFYLYN